MASGRDQTGPGLGHLPAAAGSTGLSGGREHPGDRTVGSAFGGEAVGARGGKDEAGAVPRGGSAARPTRACAVPQAARAHGSHYPWGTLESNERTFYSALSAACTLGLLEKLFENLGAWTIQPY